MPDYQQPITLGQLSGSLGLESKNAILGARRPFSIQSTGVAIPAAGAANVSVSFTLPTLGNTDAVLIEHLAGLLQAGDASGKLSISGVHADVFDAGLNLVLSLPVIAPSGITLGAAVNSWAGFYVTSPPPFRFSDLRKMTTGGVPPNTPAQPLGLSVVATFVNSDAAAHNAFMAMSGFVRIITGVTP